MTHLSEDQLKALAALLDEREREVKSGVYEHAERLREVSEPDVTGPLGDLADRADVEQARDNENAAVAREVRELRDIEAARVRIADGEAGACVDCDEEIPFARLLARPTAARCVACQERHERLYAQVPDSARAG
jgi:DnaK suppressor protein